MHRDLYPEIEPFTAGRLRVSAVHELYYEVSGNPHGEPVLFLHGGPGGGTEPRQRRFFDPRHYRIILFDQRGCGRSTPYASLWDNTTWDLVSDIERLRTHLQLSAWQLFGGSWGSTLALAYAQAHPERVTKMILRGIFTFAADEIEWFYRSSTRVLFPEAYGRFVAPIPLAERADLIGAYYRRLTDGDLEVRKSAARCWSAWECSVAALIPDEAMIDHCSDATFTLAFARIECHYFAHGGFFDPTTAILSRLDRVRHIPTTIVHGRYDAICPVRNAWRIHRAWPETKLVIVPDGGHAATEPGITSALVQATDAFRSR